MKRKINKLGEMLNKVYFDGKMPRCCTQSDIAVLQCVYNDLQAGKHPEFIQLNVKNVLENIGFLTAPKGIGWIVIS